MAASGQYAGFGNMGKSIKDTAFASAVAALVLPLGTVGSFIVMGLITSRMYYMFEGDYEAMAAFSMGTFIAAFCIVGGLYLLFYLAILHYRIRTLKAMKDAGGQSGNSDVSALAKHWLVETVMMVATAPLYAVTGIALVTRYSLPYTVPNTGAVPLLLLGNWFAVVITGMYMVVDGNKKWEPVGQLLTSYKGRAGMQYLRNSQGVGLAIFIVSHYAMAYLLYAASVGGTCGSYPYPSYCSMMGYMGGILAPVGVASGIMTLVAVVNHIKGLFRVGNSLVDLEEGRVSPSPYGGAPYGGAYYRPQSSAYPYNAERPYNAPNGRGYQNDAWNAPRYSQSMQPMQPVEPVAPSQPSYRDTSAVQGGWRVDNSPALRQSQTPVKGRCSKCNAEIPENDDVAFCPYCGARI